MLAQADEDDGYDPGSEIMENLVEEEKDPPQPEIYLNFVMGLTSPKTLKMKGQIDGHEVIVMVDPGATHNFISTTTVRELHIPVTPSQSFGVSLGTG